MESSAEPLLPPAYGRWQHELRAAFLHGVGRAPVILFVDDDELRRLAPTIDNPATDLAMAVRELVNPDRGYHMFDRAAKLIAQWAGGPRDGPPPVLPILGLSSLAAARMHSDAHVRRHNYYYRLAQVLLPGADSGDIQQAQHALLAGGFLPVADMWQSLDRWLTAQQGAFGISTIRDHPTLTRIGFPLSQAMIRRSDRAALTRFFAALQLSELGVPGPEALMAYLRLWAARPRDLSSAFLGVLFDADLRPLLQSVVTGLASSWDGRVITSEGLARCEAAVAVDLEAWSATWVIRAEGDSEPDLVRGRLGGTLAGITIRRDPYSAFARISGQPPLVDPTAIRQGFRLRGDRCIVEFAGTDLLVCRGHPDAAGWVSGGSVEPFTDHVIFAAGDLAREVRRVIAAAADAGWSQGEQLADRPLLPGFAMFHGVMFSDPGRLDVALATAPQQLRRSIRPDLATRARFVNGLPLASRIGRHHYLVGGEPDLLLPVGDGSRTVPASLDAVVQQPPFTATGFPIPLRRIGPLAAGGHTVEADLDVLRFDVLDHDPAISPVPGTGEIGWDGTGQLHRGADAPVCGAAAPRSGPTEPVLVRRGAARAWIISRAGRCWLVTDPPRLTGVLSEIGGIGGYYYELLPEPDHAWLAEERHGRISVRPLRRLGPDFAPLDPTSLNAWSTIAPYGPAEDALWQLYLKLWERQRGH